MKRAVYGAVLLLAAGCAPSKDPATTEPLRVGTLVVEPREDINAGFYVGVIEEEDAASLSFPVAGTLTRISAEEGMRVRRGDLLAELDPTSARQAAEAAEATLLQGARRSGAASSAP